MIDKKFGIGILMILGGMLLHCIKGNNDVPFWVSLFYVIQNSAMTLICLCGLKTKDFFIRISSVVGLTYFSSAALFYAYAFATNQLIYFSNSGFAGNVLFLLIIIAIILTLIDAWRGGK